MMKIKKTLCLLLSSLLISMTLLTGCSPEDEALVTEILTEVLEESLEYEEVTEEVSVDENIPEQETVAEEVQPEIIDIESEPEESILAEDGTYTTKDEVAAYLHEYGHLPSNFIKKNDAKKLGWVSSEGNLGEVAPGMSIGGDYFGNYEGNLPEKDGRDYYECDIDFDGTYRNGKRIVYSDDGLIYYTDDHYETFELLYGEE